MAWVTLHNVLEPDKNLHGTVPHTATVLVTPGAFKNDHSFIDIRHCLSVITKEGRKCVKKLEKLEGKAITLTEFIKKFPTFSDNIEWNFGKSGYLTHFSDGLYDRRIINKTLKKEKLLKVKDDPFGFMVYCQLDLNPWLREQPRETIEAIASHVFFGYVHEEADKAKFSAARREWIESLLA